MRYIYIDALVTICYNNDDNNDDNDDNDDNND